LTYLNFVFDFIIQHIDFDLWIELKSLDQKEYVTLASLISEGLVYGITLGIKSSFMVFVFIWVRAAFPRIRFDQLMTFCWTILLPLIFAFIILIPCLLYSFDSFVSNVSLFSLPLMVINKDSLKKR
jgi:NADH-ubiquinone oxidoreductase chain 1